VDIYCIGFATSSDGQFYFAMMHNVMRELLNARLEAAFEAYQDWLHNNPEGTYADYLQTQPETYVCVSYVAVVCQLL
jgi:hypothetical protein